MGTVIVDPVTRIEGHLKIEAEVTNGVITDVHASGTMARGLEKLLVGRDTRDANYVTERVCGVCFGSHGWCSSLAVETAHGTTALPELARILRNLIVGAAWLHDHPLHFYHLSALDYLDLAVLVNYTGTDPYIQKIRDLIIANDAAPLLPRYEPDGYSINDLDTVVAAVSHYLDALVMQVKAKRMSALFSGKQPHQSAIVTGGVTYLPTAAQIAEFRTMLAEQTDFINNVYINDVVTLGTGPLLGLATSDVGVGYQNYLSFGGFPDPADPSGMGYVYPAGAIVNGSLVETDPAAIQAVLAEDVTYGWYVPGTGGHPYDESQDFDLDKAGAYTFSKAPRYNGSPMEVGPLARMMVMVQRGVSHPAVQQFIDLVNAGVQPNAVARHAARALETKMICEAMVRWLDELEARIGGGDNIIHDTAHWDPPTGPSQGYGLVEAPRGALGHWIKTDNALTDNYAMIVPTTWNVSPRDASGVIGPIEKALMGCPIPDELNPNNIVRIVRSFDPCIACAVHVIDAEGNEINTVTI